MIGQSVADLIAELKLDINNYEAGIADVKGANKEFKEDTKTVTEQAKMCWTEINSAISVGKQVIGEVNQALDQTVGEYVRYADQVENLHRLSGMSYEDASRLIQASKDLFVSQQTLESGMEFAIRQGYQPSVEWLKQMADHIMAIQDPAERSQEAIKIFGRYAGPDMMKLLEQGGQGIQEYMDKIDASLILDDQAIQKAREYKQAQDDLNDAFTAFKYSIVSKGIEPLAAYLELWAAMPGLVEHGWNAIVYGIGGSADKSEAELQKMMNSYSGFSKVLGSMIDGSKNIAEEEKARTEAAQALSNEYSALIGLTVDLTGVTQTYNDKMADLTKQEEDLNQKIADLEAKKYLTAAQKQDLLDLQGKLGDVQGTMQKTEEQFDKSALKIVWDLLQAKLAADGLSDADFNMLMQTGVAFGIFDQKTADTATKINGLADQVVAGSLLFNQFSTDVENALNLPDSKTFTLNMVTNHIDNYNSTYPGRNVIPAIPMAEGGDWSVFEPTLFMAGEAGPERATFTPLGAGSGAKPGATYNFYFKDTTLDEYQLRRALDRMRFLNG